MIMKRNWTVESAREHVLAVEAKKKPRGLMYCSALSYLGVAPDTLTEQVRAEQEAEEARQKLLRAAVIETKPKKKS
ncbi:MAG: hypothetical protein IJ337_09820 [Clostridia bacterium]|nr:hypothetical protein [Clostridia bacterium]